MTSQPNVVLLVVDTLRADHLGCYGYARPTSPHVDALATQGVVLDRFICAGIPTHPSFTTTFTGQHPIVHRIVTQGPKNELAKDAPYLAQSLLAEGYTTCAVDNLAQGRQWFRRGYEFYVDPSVHHILNLDVSAEELNARAIPWLREHRAERFFLFVHYWDPHWPLTPPPRYRGLFYSGRPTDPANHSLEPFWRHPVGIMAKDTWLRRPEGFVTDTRYVEALYDQEIRHLDDGVGAVLAALDELGLADDTLVVLMADHGESMTEHGVYFDHHGLHDPVVHVPFIARWPGHLPAGARRAGLRQHHDVAPTILEGLGVEVPAEMTGESFWGALTGAAVDEGRELAFTCENTWQKKWSVRTAQHKLIVALEPDSYGNPRRELYDLQADPGETRNLADEQPDLADELEAEIDAWIAEQLSEQGQELDPVREQEMTLSSG